MRLSFIPTTITGPLWDPRFQPLTRKGQDHASRISPIPGRPLWALAMATGSSFPTYLPAIWESLSVEAQATGSSLGTFPLRAYTRLITNRPFVPMNMRRLYISSGQLRKSRLCSSMSQISKRKPACMDGSITRPAEQKGSANIRKMGRLNAPGSVLSIMKMATGSAGRSTNSISALPGPIPRTFPLNASARRSWPAP